MSYSNEPEWTPWGAVSTAIDMMKDMAKTITKGEKDPVISGAFTLLIIGFAPFVILGFVLISFLWFLGKKAFNNRQR